MLCPSLPRPECVTLALLQGSVTSEHALRGAQHGRSMSGAVQQSPLHAQQAGAQQHGTASQPLETEQQVALHQHAAVGNQPSKVASQQPGTAHQRPSAAHQQAASQQPVGGSSSQQPATQQPESADANQYTASGVAHGVPNAAGKHVPRAKHYALARLKNINNMRQLTSLSTTGLQKLRWESPFNVAQLHSCDRACVQWNVVLVCCKPCLSSWAIHLLDCRLNTSIALLIVTNMASLLSQT